MADDLYPAYIALIRRELKLAAASDALAELRVRLSSEDPAEKPPPRAPAMVRLNQALLRLDQHATPDTTLDAFAADLKFLQLFSLDEPLLTPEATDRLLRDIRGDLQKPGDPKVVPMPRSKKRGGA